MYTDSRPSLAPLLRTMAAILCLCLGVIGLVLPLIPGIPLLIVGALLLRRRGYRAPPAIGRSGLTTFERFELQFWLLARRITTSAESIRLSRRARARARQRDR